MLTSRPLLGALAGALLAIVWIVFDGWAVLLVAGLAVIGWLIGSILDKPDVVIRMLERLQNR